MSGFIVFRDSVEAALQAQDAQNGDNAT